MTIFAIEITARFYDSKVLDLSLWLAQPHQFYRQSRSLPSTVRLACFGSDSVRLSLKIPSISSSTSPLLCYLSASSIWSQALCALILFTLPICPAPFLIPFSILPISPALYFGQLPLPLLLQVLKIGKTDQNGGKVKSVRFSTDTQQSLCWTVRSKDRHFTFYILQPSRIIWTRATIRFHIE